MQNIFQDASVQLSSVCAGPVQLSSVCAGPVQRFIKLMMRKIKQFNSMTMIAVENMYVHMTQLSRDGQCTNNNCVHIHHILC